MKKEKSFAELETEAKEILAKRDAISLKEERLKGLYKKYHTEYCFVLDQVRHKKVTELLTREDKFKSGEVYWKNKKRWESDTTIMVKLIGVGEDSSSSREKIFVACALSYNPKHPLWNGSYSIDKKAVYPYQLSKEYELSSKDEFDTLKKLMIDNLENPDGENW
jgi:hypothetical protein